MAEPKFTLKTQDGVVEEKVISKGKIYTLLVTTSKDISGGSFYLGAVRLSNVIKMEPAITIPLSGTQQASQVSKRA